MYTEKFIRRDGAHECDEFCIVTLRTIVGYLYKVFITRTQDNLINLSTSSVYNPMNKDGCAQYQALDLHEGKLPTAMRSPNTSRGYNNNDSTPFINIYN
jgi:hypothetical protein